MNFKICCTDENIYEVNEIIFNKHKLTGYISLENCYYIVRDNNVTICNKDEYDKANVMPYSLKRLQDSAFKITDVLQDLPAHPSVFSLYKAKYARELAVSHQNICTMCGITTPEKPNTHHKDCFSYDDNENFSDEKPNPIGVCPKCNSDEISIDSSREMGSSIITCRDCDFYLEGNCPETTLIKAFKKLCTK